MCPCEKVIAALNLIIGLATLGSNNCNQTFTITDHDSFTSLRRNVVCFGSLSCWTTQLRSRFRSQTDGRTLSFKTLLQDLMVPSIMASCPGPEAAKQPQTITLPPPQTITLPPPQTITLPPPQTITPPSHYHHHRPSHYHHHRPSHYHHHRPSHYHTHRPSHTHYEGETLILLCLYVLCLLYAPIHQKKFQVGVNLLGNKSNSDS